MLLDLLHANIGFMLIGLRALNVAFALVEIYH